MKAAQALAGWLTGVKTGQAALIEAERKLGAHIANPPKSADAGEHRGWLATRRQLEDDVEAERGALAIAEKRAADAKAAAADEEADAEERRIDKVIAEHAKLTVEIGGDVERLAPKLERHTAMRAEIEAWNARRGSRSFRQDGEAKVREIPAKDFPAEWREIEVYRNEHGHTPSQFREVDGELVPADHGVYSKRRERVISRNAYSRPAEIPGGRFDGMRLIGLKGQIFPSR